MIVSNPDVRVHEMFHYDIALRELHSYLVLSSTIFQSLSVRGICDTQTYLHFSIYKGQKVGVESLECMDGWTPLRLYDY